MTSTPPSAPIERASPLARPLVLIVDDFDDGRAMYAAYLRFVRFRVDEASNGRQALDMAFSLRPDLVLMDLALPVLDGWETTRRLRLDPRTSRTPIVALTGHGLADDGPRAIACGCDDFVRKPCLPEELVARLRALVRGTTRRPTGSPRREFEGR